MELIFGFAIIAIVGVHALRIGITDTAYAVRGKPSPRMELRKAALAAAAAAEGKPVRYGAWGYAADLVDDAWINARKRRVAAQSGDAPAKAKPMRDYFGARWATVWDDASTKHQLNAAAKREKRGWPPVHADDTQSEPAGGAAGGGSDGVADAFDSAPRDCVVLDPPAGDADKPVREDRPGPAEPEPPSPPAAPKTPAEQVESLARKAFFHRDEKYPVTGAHDGYRREAAWREAEKAAVAALPPEERLPEFSPEDLEFLREQHPDGHQLLMDNPSLWKDRDEWPRFDTPEPEPQDRGPLADVIPLNRNTNRKETLMSNNRDAETDGLEAAKAWAEAILVEADGMPTEIETAEETLRGREVTGEPLRLLSDMQEKFEELSTIMQNFLSELKKQDTVADAYAAVPDAGGKAFLNS